MATAKRGENLTFDPSSISPSQGELTYIGDILLKDASITQRRQYLKYLRKEVLPPDTPDFDIKLRHSNPTGSRITILTVRCGKAMSTKVAEILSTALCGEGSHPEIFISKLALGANQTSKRDHESIYKVHNEYLADVSHLLFSASNPIDVAVTEFFDSGATVTRTPRQWAKSLVSPDGTSLEADLENGGAPGGKAILVVPSASRLLATAELHNYWKRRNPTLSHAAKLYKESTMAYPDIPTTVFTKNIHTILSKKIKPQMDAPTDESSTTLSPASSLTGGGSKGTRLQTKGSIAWRKPLQETLLANATVASLQQRPAAHGKSTDKSSAELNQLKQIAILEAQLALRPGPTSDESQTSKSAKSRVSRSSSHSSGLTAASAHSRLDKYETSLQEIKTMLQHLTVVHSNIPSSVQPLADKLQHHSDPGGELLSNPPTLASSPGHGMAGIQLFPEDQGCTSLVLLGTPARRGNSSKRRKATNSPTKSPSSSSNLSLQYNETTGSSGGDSC